MEAREHRFRAGRGAADVAGLSLRPDDPVALYVFGHGAGAGMRHPFMDAMAVALAGRGVATFRYDFPYMQAGSRRPDPQPVLLATVRSAVGFASETFAGLPCFAGGKSMGGRMTSLAAAQEPLPGVRGLVFFGFPLHPAGRPSADRAEHLAAVAVPMLFLQGSRDTLADLTLLRPVCEALGEHATLHVVEGADHGFHVLKRSGTTDAEVREGLADTAAAWMRARLAGSAV